jgi:hypothetical protein
MCALFALVIFTNTAAYDATISIQTTDLPYEGQTTLDINGDINTTYTLIYDNWLEGPDTILMTDPLYQLPVTITIPNQTSSGNYTRTVFLTNDTTTQEKTILITITQGTIDNDHDGHTLPADCNDNDPAINPGRTEIYFNGKDDDCNPLTEDDYNFFIELSNNNPSIGDPMLLTIHALNQSNVLIEICEQGTGFVPCYYPISMPNQTYPSTLRLFYTNQTGTYTVTATMNYQGNTRTKEVAYAVKNSISLTVEGDTSVDINQPIFLAAYAAGGIPPYTYTWTIPEKGQFLTPTINITYASAGERIGWLRIRDKEANEVNTTVNLVIKKLYAVTVTVGDNTTLTAIPDTKITVEDTERTSDSNGQAQFSMSSGTYTFSTIKDGYELQNTRYRIDEDTSFTIKLIKKDTAPPTVTIQYPTNNTALNSPYALTFSVQDQNPVTCELYLSKASEALAKKNTTGTSSSPTFIQTLSLPPGPYKTQVTCTDNKKNKGQSGIVFFTIGTAPPPDQTTGPISPDSTTPETTSEIPAERQNLLQALYDGIDRKAQFGFQEQEAANLINYEKTINDALKTIERVNRDLNDLRYRKDLTDKQKEERTQEYFNSIDRLYTTIPISLKVNANKKFVMYPTESDISAFAESYYDKPSKNFIDYVSSLQKKMTTATTVIQLTIEYVDGTKKEATIISKDITISNLSRDERIIEYIPSDLAQETEIHFITPAVKTKEGTYEVSVEEEHTKTVYLLDKIITPEKAQTQSAILINKKISPATDMPTGRVVYSLKDTITTKNLLIILITILAAFYFLHSTEQFDRIGHLLNKKSKAKTYILVLLNDIKEQLNAGNTTTALHVLNDVKDAYSTLSSDLQAELHPDIRKTSELIDVAVLKERMTACETYLSEQEWDLAIEEYHNMKSLFDILPDQDKQEAFQSIVTLHNRLQQGLNK